MALVQSRASDPELSLDPRTDPFPEWNALNASDWLPTTITSPMLEDVLSEWGEVSPHFCLQLKYLNLEGNHFGLHAPSIAQHLSTRCRCVALPMSDNIAAMDNEP